MKLVYPELSLLHPLEPEDLVVGMKARPQHSFVRCECGEIREVKNWNLTSGSTVTCGKKECRDKYRARVDAATAAINGNRNSNMTIPKQVPVQVAVKPVLVQNPKPEKNHAQSILERAIDKAQNSIRDRVSKLRKLVDEYEESSMQDVIKEIEAKITGEATGDPKAALIAIDILTQVQELPEIASLDHRSKQLSNSQPQESDVARFKNKFPMKRIALVVSSGHVECPEDMKSVWCVVKLDSFVTPDKQEVVDLLRRICVKKEFCRVVLSTSSLSKKTEDSIHQACVNASVEFETTQGAVDFSSFLHELMTG